MFAWAGVKNDCLIRISELVNLQQFYQGMRSIKAFEMDMITKLFKEFVHFYTAVCKETQDLLDSPGFY